MDAAFWATFAVEGTQAASQAAAATIVIAATAMTPPPKRQMRRVKNALPMAAMIWANFSVRPMPSSCLKPPTRTAP